MAVATEKQDNPTRWKLKPQIAAAYARLASLRNQAANYWKTFTCPAYTGPALVNLVAACTAPDGSYWAVQSWDRDLPDYGVSADVAESQIEVHLSHWTGSTLAVLTVHADWSYAGRWNHLWGTYTYDGLGVYGLALDLGRRPPRQLRPQPLRRHLRLGLRPGLEAREQLPHPRAARLLVLQRQSARLTSGRNRKRLPHHGPRPGRHARRRRHDPGPAAVRQGDTGAERRRDAGARRLGLRAARGRRDGRGEAMRTRECASSRRRQRTSWSVAPRSCCSPPRGCT